MINNLETHPRLQAASLQAHAMGLMIRYAHKTLIAYQNVVVHIIMVIVLIV